MMLNAREVERRVRIAFKAGETAREYIKRGYVEQVLGPQTPENVADYNSRLAGFVESEILKFQARRRSAKNKSKSS